MARNRPDLAEQLDTAQVRLERRSIAVAVVGEFKRGKSTLINALLQTAVCPTDADVVTVVPTVVRYGEEVSATAYVEPTGESTELTTEPVPVDAIKDFVSEDGNPGNRRTLRSVEVRLNHRMLRSGLCLTDTPGVGGLDSAHGIITMSALDVAQAVIFVTDASQELTAPELDFLRSALERCPLAACVITKTDLYPEWRRIAETDRGHLRRAGIDIPVIAVSSFLRLRARRQPELLAESGFIELVEYLARDVVGTANSSAAASAAQDVQFVAGQLGKEIAAERTVIDKPEQAEAVVEKLRDEGRRAARLISPTATWQQVLSDGMQDLVANVEHDLQERLRGVLRESEGIIDRGDPKDAWDDVQVWLRKEVVGAAVANFDLLSEQAQDLASEVAVRFSLEAGESFALDTDAPAEALSGLNLASAESLAAPGGRLGSMLLATRTAVFIPMLLFGVAGSLLGAVIMAPLATVLAAGIGQKLIRDEKKRQIAHRRQQAKMSTRKYIEEVGFIMNKETRDALRRTQRHLRDVFALRATSLQRSSSNALAAATKAAQLPADERRLRAAVLAAESAEVQDVGAKARTLSASGAVDG